MAFLLQNNKKQQRSSNTKGAGNIPAPFALFRKNGVYLMKMAKMSFLRRGPGALRPAAPNIRFRGLEPVAVAWPPMFRPTAATLGPRALRCIWLPGANVAFRSAAATTSGQNPAMPQVGKAQLPRGAVLVPVFASSSLYFWYSVCTRASRSQSRSRVMFFSASVFSSRFCISTTAMPKVSFPLRSTSQ